MGLIALFLGNGIAKEWGTDPKELIKEGMSMMRDGGKEKEDPGTTPSVPTDPEKPGEVVKLSPSQKAATDKVKEDKELSTDIAQHAKDTK